MTPQAAPCLAAGGRSATTPSSCWPASPRWSRRWSACWPSPAASSTLAPDFLTEFVLYALSATNLTMLVALVFVLARNIVKLVVERRRALPFARFRAKLVARPARDDADSGGAGAARRQRADSQQRRPLVQRADGRDAHVGERHRRRLLPGAAARWWRRRRSGSRAALAGVDLAAPSRAAVRASSRPTCCRSASSWSRSTASAAAPTATRRSCRSSTWPARRCRADYSRAVGRSARRARGRRRRGRASVSSCRVAAS